MDDEITIINTKSRNEKIKQFFLENKKKLLSIIVVSILGLIFFYSFQIFKDNKRKFVADKYYTTIIEYNNVNKKKTLQNLKEIINFKDSTYSPLALYFIIDNDLENNKDVINDLFNVLIDKTSLELEIKNLIIYKKGLFFADHVNESQILNILNPVINSQSVWRSHVLYLLAEYFYSKNEKQKSKEFYNQILLTENANQDLVKEAQKRLNRDLGE